MKKDNKDKKVSCSKQHRIGRSVRQQERLFNFSLSMVSLLTAVAVVVVFMVPSLVIKGGAALALWGCYRMFYNCLLK